MKPKTLLLELDESGYGRITTNILKYKTRINKLYEAQPEKTKLISLEDHKLCLIFPESWFRFPIAKREYTEEERERVRVRFEKSLGRSGSKNDAEDKDFS